MILSRPYTSEIYLRRMDETLSHIILAMLVSRGSICLAYLASCHCCNSSVTRHYINNNPFSSLCNTPAIWMSALWSSLHTCSGEVLILFIHSEFRFFGHMDMPEFFESICRRSHGRKIFVTSHTDQLVEHETLDRMWA